MRKRQDRALTAPIEYWHALLRPDVELSEGFWLDLSSRMRQARLTFGGRLNCPFLRPIFVSPRELERVSTVAETIAAVGERVVAAAAADTTLLDELGLTDDEQRLVAIDPGYARASTASRLDSFLLPDSLSFAEYNAESPAGLAYTETLSQLFNELPIMRRFEGRYETRYFPLSESILRALLESYREWGGRADPPTILITDWREVPTWAEFEILQERFEGLGVPTVVLDPRELVFERGELVADGRRVDLVYRRVLINDILARPDECRALVDAYAARAVCVANTFRCKIPHKKAFFALLTDPRHERLMTPAQRAVVAKHVPWTRVLADVSTTAEDGREVALLEHVRTDREQLVIKPNDEYGGAGVMLGWETDPTSWVRAVDRAIADHPGSWVAQRRIPVRREVFPIVTEPPFRVDFKDMLVDFAPYLFRGRLSGFLTRLSSSGLANVTSGGGQVPTFVVQEKS
jgi:uncharacterized circularly permuted ATP-grasp superfamily protein